MREEGKGEGWRGEREGEGMETGEGGRGEREGEERERGEGGWKGIGQGAHYCQTH